MSPTLDRQVTCLSSVGDRAFPVAAARLSASRSEAERNYSRRLASVSAGRCIVTSYYRCAQNPLHTFSRDFPVDGEVDSLLRTCYGETGVMDVGLYRANV